MNTPNALGRFLLRTGRSRNGFARAIGVAPSQISRIVSGICGPSVPLAIAIERETNGAVPVSTWAHRSRLRSKPAPIQKAKSMPRKRSTNRSAA